MACHCLARRISVVIRMCRGWWLGLLLGFEGEGREEGREEGRGLQVNRGRKEVRHCQSHGLHHIPIAPHSSIALL